MLALLSRYLMPALAAVALLGWGAAGIQTLRISWINQDIQEAETEHAKQMLKEMSAARAKEQEWSLITQEIANAKENQLRAVADERDRAIAGLRNRPRDRLPTTPDACSGASPSALSESDAAVALRLAAEADELRANYQACKSWADSLSR